MLYLALLPQFIDPTRGSIAVQSLTLGLIQIVIALGVNALIVLSAATLAGFLGRRTAWMRAQRYLMGGVLAALAVRLARRPRTGGVRLAGSEPGPQVSSSAPAPR